VTVGEKELEGSGLRFPGLERTVTDVFVRLNRLDGTTMTAVVRPTRPYVRLLGERLWYATAGEYISLGLHHILQGVDHLLFIIGLLLIVKSRMTLPKTVTAFTAAFRIHDLRHTAAPHLAMAVVPLSTIGRRSNVCRIGKRGKDSHKPSQNEKGLRPGNP
jgi:hypothetical protein